MVAYNLCNYYNYYALMAWGSCLQKYCTQAVPGPAYEIGNEFLIWLKCSCFYPLCYQSDHNKILHIPRQLCCLGMCKILLWSDDNSLLTLLINFQIWNSIEILSVGCLPGLGSEFATAPSVSYQHGGCWWPGTYMLPDHLQPLYWLYIELVNKLKENYSIW